MRIASQASCSLHRRVDFACVSPSSTVGGRMFPTVSARSIAGLLPLGFCLYRRQGEVSTCLSSVSFRPFLGICGSVVAALLP